MNSRLPQQLRFWLLPLVWLALSASYPVREGTEVQVGMGGGEYEAQGCTLERRRLVGGAATLRYRPNDSGWNGTVSGGVTSEQVIAEKDEKKGWIKKNGTWLSVGYGLARVGYHGRWAALELGPSLLLAEGRAWPLPSAVLRGNLTNRHSIFISVMEKPAGMIYGPVMAGYTFDGSANRFEAGIHSSASGKLNMWGLSYQRRMAGALWAGLGARLGTSGERGPQGALLVELAYQNSRQPDSSGFITPTPRPLRWEEFEEAVTGNAKPASNQEW